MDRRRRALVLAGLASFMKQAHGQTLLAKPVPASGEKLPVIGVGTWQTFDVGDAPAAREPLRGVLQLLHGNVVDSSPMYGAAESVVGDLVSELGVRDKLFLATKVWTSGREQGLRQME